MSGTPPVSARSAIAAAVAAGLVLAIGGGVWLNRKTAAGVTIGGPFALRDGQGRRVTDRDFRGRYMLVYFGYTHCPDACPTTLNDIATAYARLPPADRARLAPVFITVDPARDTQAVMGDYVRAFGPEIVGLTGDSESVSEAEQEYHVYAQKSPLKDGDYTMDHSSLLYLVGPDGRFLAILPAEESPAQLAAALRERGV